MRRKPPRLVRFVFVFEKLNTYIYLADFNFIPIEKVRNFAASGNRNVVNKKSLKLDPIRLAYLTSALVSITS